MERLTKAKIVRAAFGTAVILGSFLHPESAEAQVPGQDPLDIVPDNYSRRILLTCLPENNMADITFVGHTAFADGDLHQFDGGFVVVIGSLKSNESLAFVAGSVVANQESASRVIVPFGNISDHDPDRLTTYRPADDRPFVVGTRSVSFTGTQTKESLAAGCYAEPQ